MKNEKTIKVTLRRQFMGGYQIEKIVGAVDIEFTMPEQGSPRSTRKNFLAGSSLNLQEAKFLAGIRSYEVTTLPSK